MRASLVQELSDPSDKIYARSQGNLDFLPNHNYFMSYGSIPKMKEYGSYGKTLMTVQYGPIQGVSSVFSYRGHKSPWVGYPREPPALSACSLGGDGIKVWMSWNGATEYDHWKVYSGEHQSDLGYVDSFERSGFETSAQIPRTSTYVQVIALGPRINATKSAVVKVTRKC